MKTRLALLLAGCALVANTIAAQKPEPSPERFGYISDPPPSESRALRKGPVAPLEEDRLKYASFLSQSGTGLVRLLPRWTFSNAPQSPAPESRPWGPRDFGINGGGAYFSFYYRTHEYGRGSDIELNRRALGRDLKFYGDHDELRPDLKSYEGVPSEGTFSVGFAGADYGMMTDLGDLPLESISIDHASLAFLLKYRPPRPEPQARCEARRFNAGVAADGRLYNRRLPIKTGATYLLRSIVYDRYDVLVAIKVVRQENDGSVTIAWKLLKKFERTDLQRVEHLNQNTLICPPG
jgi:hypothetical protein